MDKTVLQALKDNGFIFRKYTGVETEETFIINGEVLIIPTTLELIKAGADYFSLGDKLDTKEEIANVWMSKNFVEKQKIYSKVK